MKAFVLLAIIAGAVLVAVDGACKLEEAKKCAIKVVTDAQSALTGKDKAKVCEFGKKLAGCGAYLNGCSQKDIDGMNDVIKAFNSEPYNCNIKLGASGVTAAVVTTATSSNIKLGASGVTAAVVTMVLAAAAAFIMK